METGKYSFFFAVLFPLHFSWCPAKSMESNSTARAVMTEKSHFQRRILLASILRKHAQRRAAIVVGLQISKTEKRWDKKICKNKRLHTWTRTSHFVEPMNKTAKIAKHIYSRHIRKAFSIHFLILVTCRQCDIEIHRESDELWWWWKVYKNSRKIMFSFYHFHPSPLLLSSFRLAVCS